MRNRILLSLVFVLILVLSGHSQNTKDKKNKIEKDTTQIEDTYHPVATYYYTCPVHTKVHLEQAGNCPQCGMTLDKKKEVIYYSCPKHTDVKQDKKGKCEKCGADLEKEE